MLLTHHSSLITHRFFVMNYFNYFTEIEDTFVRRRGKHVLLSPLDWALIESWKEKGVPLHIALNGIERSFDSYEAKPRKRSVKSLLYCQEEVEAQLQPYKNRMERDTYEQTFDNLLLKRLRDQYELPRLSLFYL